LIVSICPVIQENIAIALAKIGLKYVGTVVGLA